MKIVLGQLNIQQGMLEVNFNQIKEMINQAKKDNADLIVFPELCLSGYIMQDLWSSDEFCNDCISYNDKILELSDGIGIIYGNIYSDSIDNLNNGHDGRRLKANAAYFCYDKKWVKKENSFLDGIYIKHLLPNYRFFDESRHFMSALDMVDALDLNKEIFASPFIFKGNKIGLQICEDLWSENYKVDLTKMYLNQDVDYIVNVSCSPWTLGKEKGRANRVSNHFKSSNSKTKLIYVNACGMQNNGKSICVFDGDSTVYGSNGERLYFCNDLFNQEYKLIDFDNPVEIKEETNNKLLKALLAAIYEFDKQIMNSSVKWIIGLSGGLDSSVNAALLTMALGPKRIVGYNMASKYNTDSTISNAKTMADKLKIELREGSIEKLVEASNLTLDEFGYNDDYPSLVYENIQARIRGHLLSTFASVENGVVVNNGNKVEVALGYCTLYGDAIGAFSPLGDCLKTQLFELSHQINDFYNDEIIPYSLLPEVIDNKIKWELPPSAELKDAQLDPMKWYYHDYLVQLITDYPSYKIEDFMQSYLDGSIYTSSIGSWINYYGLDNPTSFINDLEWFINTYYRNIFKRYQMPPIVSVSRGAFGNDFRESQIKPIYTERYRKLKEEILKKETNENNS